MFLSFKGAGMPELKTQLQNLLFYTAKISIINPASYNDQTDSNIEKLFSVEEIPPLSMRKSNEMDKGQISLLWLLNSTSEKQLLVNI